MNQRCAVVLAAGKGTRMESELPKVLFPACGRPMIEYVLDALGQAGATRILVVVGYRSELVRERLARWPGIEFVEQSEQRGTGHAVKMCQTQLAGFDGPVIVVTGDSPLLQSESVAALLELFDQQRPACILGTLHKANPFGLGRIVRDGQGNLAAIVEEKDATEAQRQITEVNMSTYVFDNRHLLPALAALRNDNRQQEYYITDVPGILRDAGHDVRALPVLRPCEALSINNLQELRIVEDEMIRLGYRAT